MKIGILTSGGDCPGLNAVIRGFAKYVYHEIEGAEIIGIEDGYGGLIAGEYHKMTPEDFNGILTLGGTILGTSRQPYKLMTVEEAGAESKLKKMCDNYYKMGLDCLVTLGGAGTHKTAALLAGEGLNVVGVPKTIDNDIWGTDVTFGFHTAVDIATECIDRIRTTASSHGRTMLIELMGNKVGWLTLFAGIAGGANMILIPEIPFDPDCVARTVSKVARAGKAYYVIAIAEGAMTAAEADLSKKERVAKRFERGEVTATAALARAIGEKAGVETRVVVPGHIQRGGSPSAYDRLLSTEMGGFAGRLVKEKRFGTTVAMQNDQITYNSLADIAGKTKYVPARHQLIETARHIGISFGTEDE